MRDISKFEHGGHFGLSYVPDSPRDGSIGQGDFLATTRFGSDEARSMFIGHTETTERLNQRIADLEGDLRYLKTVRGANANLREVRAMGRSVE